MSEYTHKEAFALMNYACKCGHREVIWNERDGVTPFTIGCPSCGDGMGLTHHSFWLDRCDPGHKPHRGQRVFCAMTADRAELIARKIAESRVRPGKERDDLIAYLTDDIWRNGEGADIRIEGYGRG